MQVKARKSQSTCISCHNFFLWHSIIILRLTSAHVFTAIRPCYCCSVTPKMLQQMILQAFSTVGISSKISSSSSIWDMDSGASNHMTFSSNNLSNIQLYDGKLKFILQTVGTFSSLLLMIYHVLYLCKIFFFPLDYKRISLLLVNLLTINVTFPFLILIVSCKIKTQGR